MEVTIELERKAFIIASIAVGFNFENPVQQYHAIDFFLMLIFFEVWPIVSQDKDR